MSPVNPESPAKSPSRLVALVVALATGAALWGAGLSAGVDAGDRDALSAQRVARSLSCVSGLLKGQAVVGSLGGKVSGTLAISGGVVDLTGRGRAFTLRAGVNASATTYATQYAASGPWFAAQPCAEPTRQQWFVGAGGSSLHHTTLELANTRSGEAIVDIHVFGPEGEIEAPGLRGIKVGDTPVHLEVSEVAPSLAEVAISVTAVRGLVSASAVDHWTASAVAKRLTEFLPGQAEPATDLIVGGLPARGNATLGVLNTAETAAVLELKLIGDEGTFASTDGDSVTLAPGELVQVPVPAAARQGATGVRLVSTQPIVAALRASWSADIVHGTALGALGDSAIVGVPARGKATLRLFNPDDETTVTATVDFIAPGGRTLESREVEVPAGTAVVAAPPGKGRLRVIHITGGADLRAILEVTDGGAAVIPVSSVTGETRVPAVRPLG